MKISEHFGGQPVTAGKANKEFAGAGSDFQQLLVSELRKSSISQPNQVAGSVESGSPVPASVRLEGLTVTEVTIDTLQSFARALTDGSFSAEALEPYASSLEEDTVALLAVRNQLPDSDPLAQVLDRVATVAYLEAARYRRGDYHA
jgi:hypothetical protein